LLPEAGDGYVGVANQEWFIDAFVGEFDPAAAGFVLVEAKAISCSITTARHGS
jgi:hypothetical protein